MRRLTAQFADPPSGMTATNVARGGLRSAVEQAAVAVEMVALAVAGPADRRPEQLMLATRQTALAVTTWSVAATHLDQINIDAGNGDQHVHLDSDGAEGALTADGAAEGGADASRLTPSGTSGAPPARGTGRWLPGPCSAELRG